MSKVFIIGIDGGEFRLIKPWAKQGKLPIFAKLLKEGSHGYLRSINPPVTSPAWPCFYTGKNPAKIGIFGFAKESNKGKIYSTNDVYSECVWDLLGEHNKKTISVNVPVTYPPKKINGVMISGMLTPPHKNFANPSYLYKEIKEKYPDYITSLPPVETYTLHKRKSWKKLLRGVDARINVIEYIREKFDYDLLLAVFKFTDTACHRVWEKQNFILEVYQKIDAYLGKLMKENHNIIIMSDHGFYASTKYIRINMFFEKIGLLKRKKLDISSKKWKKKISNISE